MVRVMTIEDYDQIYKLWSKIKGFGIRSIDDSREGIERFLKRNPTTSVVAEEDGKIVVENSQPIKVKKIICPVCKEKIDVETKCSPSFKDCVMSIIKIYGERIFLRENIAVLCQRLVNTRNKVLHLDKDKNDCLTGKQCGFYTKKIVMLIRLIIITECEVFENNAWEQVIKEIERFDKRFAKCRVKE